MSRCRNSLTALVAFIYFSFFFRCSCPFALPVLYFFFSSRRRHTRFDCDWSSDVCSSDLPLPAGFFLPAADSDGAALLRLHGIQVQRLAREWTDTVEVLTGTELNWATREFQGHHLLEVTGTWARTPRSVPAGCYFVSTAQPLGRLVFALLEPEGFGLARWGAFSRAPGMQLGASAGREFPVWRAGRGPPPPSPALPPAAHRRRPPPPPNANTPPRP